MHMISYISESRIPAGESTAQMRRLVSQAQKNNQVRGITGILFLRGPIFFQTIEGPTGAVQELYQSILRDDRHDSIYPLLDEPITSRRFENWSLESYHDPNCSEHFLGLIHNLGRYFLESGAFNPQSVVAYSRKLMATMAQNRLLIPTSELQSA